MTLVLALANPPTDIPGLVTVKVFNETGGTLGRSSSCDFVLPDKDLHVSKVHAIIAYNDKQYTITDVSTNGTVIGATTLSKGESHVLRSGEEISMGPYQIKVAVQTNAHTSVKNPEVTPVAVSQTQVAAASAAQVALDQESENDPEALQKKIDALVAQYDTVDKDDANLTSSTPSFDSRTTRKNTVSKVSLHDAEMTKSESAATAIIDFDIDDYIHKDSIENTSSFMTQSLGITRSGANYKEKHMAMAESELRNAVSPKKGIDEKAQQILNDKLQVKEGEEERVFADDLAVNLLLDSLGLKSIKLPKSEHRRFLADLSKILNEAVDAFIILLRDRSVVKGQLSGTSTTFERKENNPLKLSASTSEALNKMLIDPSNSYMDIDTSFNESLEDLRKHQTALVAASRRSFDVLIKRFDPEYIDLRLKQVAKPNLMKRITGANWNRKDYAKYHKVTEKDLQSIFDEAFSEAYAELVK